MWWQPSQATVSIPRSVQVSQLRPISHKTFAKVQPRKCWIARDVGILTSNDDLVLGGPATTSAAEILAQSSSESGVEDGFKNSNMLAQACPIHIHIVAILDGGAIDLTVRHTPFLLLILAAATLAAVSATAYTATTGYGIVSSSSSSFSSSSS